GCDSGFGYLFATKFHSLGYIVVACVLEEDGVGANALKAYSSERLKVLKLDLNLEADISSCHQEVEKIVRSLDTELWALINNGAVTNYIASVELMPIEVYRRYIEANILGTLNLTRRCLPLLKKSKGRIINISSLTASMHLPNMSGYSACKSALNTISDCLRQELYDDGVKVCVIQPSGFVTG
ncbi:hypothetical protein HELRODRAFT_132679, partial [Helobdella robusta]|uniref:Uncharacterized protein n=1 Tax=Helobdella robusta TaxID=6412 RepID=T1EHZ1_HELRO